jgi:hypothetical protein
MVNQFMERSKKSYDRYSSESSINNKANIKKAVKKAVKGFLPYGILSLIQNHGIGQNIKNWTLPRSVDTIKQPALS